ncbi:MAG: hypothetical protein ACJ8J0_04060 [Longimicrobiaceae bacterium]
MRTHSFHPTRRSLAAAALALLVAACADHTPTAPAAAPRIAQPRADASTALQEIVPWRDGGYRYLVGPTGVAPGFEAPGYDDSAWSTGAAAFGNGGDCPDPSWVHTPWPLNSDIVLRKMVVLPAGTASMEVEVMIDNDVQLFVNGYDVTGGMIAHEGCADVNYFILHPADVMLQPGANVIAVRARDRGVVSFFDLHVTAQVPVVTAESVCALVQQWVAQRGIANSLCAKLRAAAAAAARGDTEAKEGALGAFVNEVRAQSGKVLTAEHADALVAMAGQL